VDKDGARERDAAGGEKKKGRQREEKQRGEGENGFPKDLCANLENCRDLLVK
jgi:hypothetical protein